MISKIAYLRGVRDEARVMGDRGLERAVTADLRRLGGLDAMAVAGDTVGPVPMETAVPAPLEHAVPDAPRRAGRPKLPRCPHGNIEGRCKECS